MRQDLVRQRDRTEGYLRVDPNNKPLLIRAIELNLAVANADGAMGHVNAALALFPDDPLIVCLKAHVLSAQRRWDDAAPIYEKLLHQLHDAKLAYSLANCQVWQGRHQAALATLAPYQQDPELPATTVTMLIRALHHVGQLERALDVVRQHHARLAAEPVFLAAASLVYLDLADVEQAAALCKAALASGERPLEALVTDASLLLAQSDAERAVERFQEALALNPEDGRIWSGIGQANLLTRDLVNAAMQLEKAVRLLPNHIATWHALGWCRLFRENLTGADQAFRHALEIDRNFAETHGAIATVAAKRGERGEAEAAIELALRLDAGCLSARYAQLVLSGVAEDTERFRAVALKVIKGRKNAFGVDLADIVRTRLER